MNVPRLFRTRTFAIIAVLLIAAAAWTIRVQLTPFSISDEQGYRDVLANLAERKTKSLENWGVELIGDEEPAQYTRARTAFLTQGEAEVTMDEPPSNEESGEASSPFYSLNATSGGTATLITSDGYWLTAAHCLSPQPVQRVVIDYEQQTVELVPVRTVWEGSHEDPRLPDIALIHSPLQTSQHFTLPQPGKFAPDTEVILAGYGGAMEGISTGKIQSRTGWRGPESGPRWNIFTVMIPAGPGDSGGPILDTRGRLLGINAQAFPTYHRNFFGHTRFTGSGTRCICPHPAWIRELIKKDRADQKALAQSQ